MIIIPEKVIKEEIEILLKFTHENLKAYRAIGTCPDAADQNAGVGINVIQQGAVNTPEKTEITFPAGTNIAGTYWVISTPSTNYAIWYNTGGDTAPNVPNLSLVMVNVLVADTATLIAAKTEAVLSSLKQSGDQVFQAQVVTTSPTMVQVTNVEVNQERRSILYQIFGGLRFDKFYYFGQMAKILENKFGSNQRPLTISLGWTQNRENFPHISILLPMEENDPKNVGNVQGSINNFNGTGQKLKEHRYQTTYSLFITSDNENDVIVIYNFLKTIILIGMTNFDCAGLQNLHISGRDITMDFEIDPMNVYHRTVALTFFYNNQVGDIQLIQPIPTSVALP